MQTLLDTTHPTDAGFCGLDRPAEDGEGLTVTLADDWPTVILNGPDGEIRLEGEAEVRQVKRALEQALDAAGRRKAKAAA